MASDASVNKNTKAIEDFRRSVDKLTRAVEHQTQIMIEIAQKGKDVSFLIQNLEAPVKMTPTEVFRKTQSDIARAKGEIPE